MTDEQNRERPGRQNDEDSPGPRPPSRSSELLDLVRSAEDDARVALRKRTPAVPVPLASAEASAPSEDFVDVGDEAVDAPPSLAPIRPATPAGAFAVARRSPGPPDGPPLLAPPSEVGGGARPWSPALGIALILALAVGALVLFGR